MLYLLWTLINIALLGYFLYLIIRIGSLLGTRIGRFSAGFFLLALLSFVCHPAKDENVKPGTNEIKKWEFATQDSLEKNSSKNKIITIGTTPISKFNLGFEYGFDKKLKQLIPVNGYADVAGWTIGTKWLPINIVMNQTSKAGQFEYAVLASEEWYILGFNVYTRIITYTGMVYAN